MNTTVFSDNLRKFRLEKNLTQEEVADILCVSTQSISRWECGTTMPDVLRLPEIAELYGVTIDALYRKSSIAYKNYGQRLASVYEFTRSPEDFLRAYLEFEKMLKEGELSTLDKFNYAYIFHEMLFFCKDNSLKWYDSVIEDGYERDPHSYTRARSLRAKLLTKFGQGDEILSEQIKQVKKLPNANEWYYLSDLYLLLGKFDKAYETCITASRTFPDDWKLILNGGYALQYMGRYDEAIELFHKAGKLGVDFHDDLDALANCYDDMGDYEKAIETEKKLYEFYKNEGYEFEAQISLKYLNELRGKLDK